MKFSKHFMVICMFLVGLLFPAKVFAGTFNPFNRNTDTNVDSVCVYGNAQRSQICQPGNQRSENPVMRTIANVTQVVFIGIGFASVVLIMVGGFKYIYSQGDPGAVNAAKNTVLYALAGMAIAISGSAIIVFVIRRFI